MEGITKIEISEIEELQETFAESTFCCPPTGEH
jgi:hypothetical protein